MAKDSTQVLTAGPGASLLLAPVGTAEPATIATAFSGTWVDVGYLKTPPSIDRALTKSELNAWNAAEPLRTILDTDVSTVTLQLLQSNRAVFELYFGPLTYTSETGGVSIEPNPAGADVEKALALELVDGTKILRVIWRRCAIDSVGSIAMDKADAVSYELTLKRLTPATGEAYKIQTNVASLVSA